MYRMPEASYYTMHVQRLITLDRTDYLDVRTRAHLHTCTAVLSTLVPVLIYVRFSLNRGFAYLITTHAVF